MHAKFAKFKAGRLYTLKLSAVNAIKKAVLTVSKQKKREIESLLKNGSVINANLLHLFE